MTETLILNIHSNLYCELYKESWDNEQYGISKFYILDGDVERACYLHARDLYLVDKSSTLTVSILWEYNHSPHELLLLIFENMSRIYYNIGYNSYNIIGSYIKCKHPKLCIEVRGDIRKTALNYAIDQLIEIFGDKSIDHFTLNLESYKCNLFNVNIQDDELRIIWCNDKESLSNLIIMIITLHTLNEIILGYEYD